MLARAAPLGASRHVLSHHACDDPTNFYTVRSVPPLGKPPRLEVSFVNVDQSLLESFAARLDIVLKGVRRIMPRVEQEETDTYHHGKNWRYSS